MKHLNLLKSGSAWALGSKIALALCALAVNAALGRLLGPEFIGQYFLFVQLVILGTVLFSVGLRSGILKLNGIAVEKGDWKSVWQLVRRVLVILSISSMLGFGLLLVTWDRLSAIIFHDHVDRSLMLLAYVAIIFRLLQTFSSVFFRSIHRPRIGVLLLHLPREVGLAVAFFALFLLWERVTIDVVVSTYAGTLAVAVALCVYMVLKFRKGNASNSGTSGTSGMIGYMSLIALTAPMYVSNIASEIARTSDLWILGALGEEIDVGLYGAAKRLTLMLAMMLNVINLIIPPMIAALYEKKDLTQLERMVRSSATWSMCLVVPVALVFLMFGDEILKLVFGQGFEQGGTVLRILVLGYGLGAIVGSPGVILQMTGHQKTMMNLTLMLALVGGCSQLAVVSEYGMIGVAMVSAGIIVCQNSIMVYLVKRHTGVWTLPYARLSRAFVRT